jgi:hypothetical protein
LKRSPTTLNCAAPQQRPSKAFAPLTSRITFRSSGRALHMKAKYPSRGDRQETRQTRLLMSEQLGDSISWPFLTVLVFWICALFLGFALFARFIENIAWQLMRIARGEIKRLIINVPPRSMKSAMVSVAFTAWLLGHDPAKRIIACT